jgi:hypothetical protein
MMFALMMGVMFLLLIILSAVLLSYLGQEQRVLARFWQSMTNGQRYAIQQNYNCCGANYNPLSTWTVGGASYPIYPEWDTCAHKIGGCDADKVRALLLDGTSIDYTGDPTKATPIRINFNPNQFDRNQLHAWPCPDWKLSGINSVSGCIPAITKDFRAMSTGFGVAGIFLGVFCLTGLLASCCLLSGIRATAEQMAAVNKSKGGRR